MKSLIYQDILPYDEPPTCRNDPPRVEVTFALRKNGRLYTYTVRDKIVPEDILFVMVKAAAFAIQHGEPYNGRTPSRTVKDSLIKNNVVI